MTTPHDFFTGLIRNSEAVDAQRRAQDLDMKTRFRQIFDEVTVEDIRERFEKCVELEPVEVSKIITKREHDLSPKVLCNVLQVIFKFKFERPGDITVTPDIRIYCGSSQVHDKTTAQLRREVLARTEDLLSSAGVPADRMLIMGNRVVIDMTPPPSRRLTCTEASDLAVQASLPDTPISSILNSARAHHAAYCVEFGATYTRFMEQAVTWILDEGGMRACLTRGTCTASRRFWKRRPREDEHMQSLSAECKLRFFTKKKLLEVRFEYDGSLVTEDQKWNITYGMSRALRAAGFTTARISTSYPTLICIRLRQSATAPSDASAGP
jgi:hypothetical protein